MAGYFYIVPFINSEHLKIGISKGTFQNLNNRIVAHKLGFKAEGIEINESGILFAEFKTNKHSEFIERYILTSIERASLCRYGGTEIFHISKLKEIEKKVLEFSDNYDGKGLEIFENRLKSKTKKQTSKQLTEKEKQERREKMRLNAEEKRIKDNYENFMKFKNWFEDFEHRITIRPYRMRIKTDCMFPILDEEVDQYPHLFCVDEIVLEIQRIDFPKSFPDSWLINQYEVLGNYLTYYKNGGGYIEFGGRFSGGQCWKDDKRFQFYLDKNALYGLRILDTNCWDLVPEPIKEILSLFEHEIFEMMDKETFVEDVFSKRDRQFYERENAHFWNEISSNHTQAFR